MNVAVVGCGLVGQKRAKALAGRHTLLMACDTSLERAQSLASSHPGSRACADWKDVLRNPEVEVVIISTTHDSLSPIALAAVNAKKHVLVEKPAALTVAEIDAVAAAAAKEGVCVQVGFNHRFHPALQKARAIVDSGVIGPLMFIRGRYGHGGRVGYEKEWRADPKISGGGELMDQGVHLIDLSRWFLGDFTQCDGFVHTYFWDMPVEDNGFVFLRTREDKTAWLHASCTEWKNMFAFEIYGRHGKIQIDGLGGSYGEERLTYYQMKPAMGPPAAETWSYPGDDTSWAAEFESFASAVKTKSPVAVGLADARAALEIVLSIYNKNPI